MRLDRLVGSLTFLLCAVSLGLRAQGFQLNELGTCAVTRGQAVTSAPCADPSLIYWNPGAATMLSGWSAYLGAAVIDVGGNFTADTTGRVDDGDVPLSFIPHLFVNYTAKDSRWAVGLGVYVPYGLTSQWKGDFPGRFSAQKASLATVYVQPNFAYQFAKGWSIGGGPVFGYSQVQLRQSLDLAQQAASGPITFGQLGVPAGTEFARARLEGSATAWGVNIGLHGQITQDWQVGARYLSQLTFDYDDADATFAQVLTGLTLAAGNPLGLPAGTPVDAVLAGVAFAPGGPLNDQKVSTRIKHPAQLQVGVGYSGLLNTMISADFEWTQFSTFDELPVDFKGTAAQLSRTLIEDYRNSWSIRAGVERAFAIGIKGRAGFTYVRTPAPDVTVTPLLPDMDRRNYTVGLGVPLTPHYTLDAGYLHVDTSGRRGRLVERVSRAQTAAMLNSGFYELNANVFSLSVRANF
ncbi:MAG: outer membrane protein transport protein [Gemmatimonadaceae bacterium]|nr:outer membrane protein transport protein [Gemmatimonadaceae bacterium]